MHNHGVAYAARFDGPGNQRGPNVRHQHDDGLDVSLREPGYQFAAQKEHPRRVQDRAKWRVKSVDGEDRIAKTSEFRIKFIRSRNTEMSV
jgi:hypothetical protein